MNSSGGNTPGTVDASSFARPLALTSACCLTVLSAITITSNILLLWSIWKDPLKCFKSAATLYIIGLSLADLITGLTTEPFFAAAYFIVFLENKSQFTGALLIVYRAGAVVSGVALKYSFLVILALSWTQYVAITWPHSYKRFVTKRKVVIFQLAAFLYLVLFTSVQLTGVFNINTFLAVDLSLNTTFLSVNLFVISLLLYYRYRKRLVARTTLRKDASIRPTSIAQREKTIDHQFTVVSIYLAVILLLCALPHVILAYIFLYGYNGLTQPQRVHLQVALGVSDILLFVKVCTDPFVYAWRLPSYRKTLKELFPWWKAPSEEERLAGMRLTGNEQSSSSPKQKPSLLDQATEERTELVSEKEGTVKCKMGFYRG